jgi:chemotaxis methyl-accepting protein methylase
VSENVDPETFPEQLELLATEVTIFLRCLNEFPEFTDEAVNASILSFEGDLKVTDSYIHGCSIYSQCYSVLVFLFKGLYRYVIVFCQ